MRPIRYSEVQAAAAASLAGDERPARRLNWRAFWWGFWHPFGSRAQMMDFDQ